MKLNNKRTKIICTIGPVSSDDKTLMKLYQNGMNVARLNGSHNTLDWHRQTIKKLREILPDVAILFDLPGRKIRTAEMEKNVSFKTDEQVIFSTVDSTYPKVKVLYNNLHVDLTVGDTILADDGQFKFVVDKIVGTDIICRSCNSGEIKSKKGINVPFVKVNTPLLSAIDVTCIKFCIENDVDFIGVSFVESAHHINEVKKVIGKEDLQVISKIENKFAIENLDEIIKNSFGVMIDRGDLGAETQIYDISIWQKKIIQKARALGKPVIVATEMLHNMIHHPYPTKAEINDITNAVLDGCSAVMLSAESASGSYPLEAVDTMAKIISAAEQFSSEKIPSHKYVIQEISDSIVESVLQISHSIAVTKIVTFSLTGDAIKRLSKFEIEKPIIFVNNNLKFARKFSLYKGVEVRIADIVFNPDSEDHIMSGLHQLYKKQHIIDDDTLIITYVKYPNNNFMNSLEVQKVENLKRILHW